MNTQELETSPHPRAPTASAPARARGRGRGGPPATDANGLAATAVELGVNALLSSLFLIGGLLGLVGLVLGTAALKRAMSTSTGRRQSVTAVVTSFIAIAVSALVALLALWCAHRFHGSYQLNHVHQYGRRLLHLMLGRA
ncbi:DUF4190 domain-containing protein [Kitasatospora acidiphila]|uniref:DUF4190 domain-containing protein n=1 Tax=Kitasatospora acidiphila TaxID=2567942 RepID=A0A540W0Y2_9ACTN|nr:DUF4190 domain-containing protein [Kitasatospora acidiphila]TQF02680.1 DUF4190 domain-containing protein [Kitasatospora acidiphila]